MIAAVSAWLDALVFLRPWWLLALPAALLAAWAWRRRASRASPWHGVVDAGLQPFVLEGGRSGGRTLPWRWFVLYLLAVLALAGPAWQELEQPLLESRDALVVALDLSSSSRAGDLAPDRATRARLKLSRLLELRQDGQLGVLAFAGSAHVVSPLTRDVRTLRRLVDALEPGLMPLDGHRPDLAIERALAMMKGAGEARGRILLVTDRADAAALAAARSARESGFTVHVLGLGTPEGAPVRTPTGGFTRDTADRLRMARLDTSSLERLAAAGGGGFTAIRADDGDLSALGVLAPAASAAAGGAADRRVLHSQDGGFWLVLLMLPLLLPEFRRGGLLAFSLLLFIAPFEPAAASGVADRFKRDDQRAWQALVQGDPERALGLARDPELRGAAAFRAGDFDTAIEAFGQSEGARGSYNSGNALAAAGRYEEALAAWRQALEREPGHEDAMANIEALERWLSQQPPGSDPAGEGGQGDGRSETDPTESPDDGADPDQGEVEDQPADTGRPGNGDAGEGDDEAAEGEPGPGSEGEAPGDDPAPVDPADRAAAEQAVREAIEAALRERAEVPGTDEGDAQPIDAEALAEREQADAIERWLRLVDDDPGALLRRKFMIEHQRAQRMGGQ